LKWKEKTEILRKYSAWIQYQDTIEVESRKRKEKANPKKAQNGKAC